MREEAAVLIGGLIPLVFHYYGGHDYLHQGGCRPGRRAQVCVVPVAPRRRGCGLRGKDE